MEFADWVSEKITVIDALKDQHQIEEKIFSLALNSDDETANLIIGGIDMNLIDLAMPWYTFKLSSRAEWTSDITGITAHGKEIKNVRYRNALFDSGTSHLIFDDETLERFINVSTANNITCEEGDFELTCTVNRTVLAKYPNWPSDQDSIEKLVDQVFPTLNFSMSNQSFTLEPQYYANSCSGDVTDEITCKFLMAAFPVDVLILGDPLFRKYYVGFFEDKDTVMLFHSPKPAKSKLRFNRNKPGLFSSFLGRH